MMSDQETFLRFGNMLIGRKKHKIIQRLGWRKGKEGSITKKVLRGMRDG
jgi:hypothetical protein